MHTRHSHKLLNRKAAERYAHQNLPILIRDIERAGLIERPICSKFATSLNCELNRRKEVGEDLAFSVVNQSVSKSNVDKKSRYGHRPSSYVTVTSWLIPATVAGLS